MDMKDRVELITESRQFDARWYASRYPDVAILGMEPLEHFLKIGEALGRSPGPEFDTKFYRETYAIWHPSGSPLADFLSAEEISSRPTTRSELQRHLAEAIVRTTNEWGQAEERKISYCIPVMNRLDDIKGTLAHNLNANSDFHDDVEFLVIEFGQSREVSEWISSEPTFQRALADGVLRVVSDPETLDIWHFGRAKNAFRKHLRGQIYSSLDADNFVTAEETAWLLKQAEKYPLGFIAHHFSGDFGDGTCGRVSMPTSLYRDVGYDPRMLPRQWDELGLIAKAMKWFPSAPLIVAGDGLSIMDYKFTFRDFIISELMPNHIVVCDYPSRVLPLNPTGTGYLNEDPALLQYENYNSALARSKLTNSTARQTAYMERTQRAGRGLIETTSAERLVEILFGISGALKKAKADELCLFVSARDEPDFLLRFLDHYRSLGVDRFYIVDDGSKVPIAELDLGPEVVVVRPRVGDFKTSKGLWLGALSNYIVPEGAWMLTVDTDELVQVPKPVDSLKDLIARLDKEGVSSVPGLLIDMLPSDPSAVFDGEQDPINYFDSFCWMRTPVDPSYKSEDAIIWGFGKHADLSWRVDARYHAFGTIDCLRKIPLFRRTSGWHLNEGFHTLFPASETKGQRVTSRIFEQSIILPIFHYKLTRLWSEEARQRMVDMLDDYDAPTRKNIRTYFESRDGIKKLATLKAHLRPKEDALNGERSSREIQLVSKNTGKRKKSLVAGERPFLVLALQRTGGTNFASALTSISSYPSATDHEPFLERREFGNVTREWNAREDAGKLSKSMYDILSKSINIKHCVEVVPTAINNALISSAQQHDYRFLFLYRQDPVARILSAEFARRSNIWGPNDRGTNAGEQQIFSDPLDVEELLAKEATNISLINALWARSGKNTGMVAAISYEEIYCSDQRHATSSIGRALEVMKLSKGPRADAELVEKIRSSGNQGTRDKYSQFKRCEALREGAKTLPRFSF